ncbi:MAG: UMP kinase [Methanobacteriota archaeon]
MNRSRARSPGGMETVVVSIGGSVLLPRSVDAHYIKKLARMLEGASRDVNIFAVVGAGWIARFYKDLGLELGCKELTLDENGIAVTRLNASLLITALGAKANPKPAFTVEEAISLASRYDIVVMGGETPGQTTDSVAAQIASMTGAARVVNATDVDGVYDSDPRKNPKARRLDTMTFAQFAELCGKARHSPGMHVPFDPSGARLVSKKKIVTVILDGKDLASFKGAILGRKFKGTVVGG